jgi:hypothetical protein
MESVEEGTRIEGEAWGVEQPNRIGTNGIESKGRLEEIETDRSKSNRIKGEAWGIDRFNRKRTNGRDSAIGGTRIEGEAWGVEQPNQLGTNGIESKGKLVGEIETVNQIESKGRLEESINSIERDRIEGTRLSEGLELKERLEASNHRIENKLNRIEGKTWRDREGTK